ncbi:MAG: hypothetical protein ABI615_11005 [Chthoniobacterales bacterium]
MKIANFKGRCIIFIVCAMGSGALWGGWYFVSNVASRPQNYDAIVAVTMGLRGRWMVRSIARTHPQLHLAVGEALPESLVKSLQPKYKPGEFILFFKSKYIFFGPLQLKKVQFMPPPFADVRSPANAANMAAYMDELLIKKKMSPP